MTDQTKKSPEEERERKQERVRDKAHRKRVNSHLRDIDLSNYDKYSDLDDLYK